MSWVTSKSSRPWKMVIQKLRSPKLLDGLKDYSQYGLLQFKVCFQEPFVASSKVLFEFSKRIKNQLPKRKSSILSKLGRLLPICFVTLFT